MNFAETFRSRKLIIHGWYKKNLRDLPIRQTRDPYQTWVAEVILQQTRMDQGLPYIQDFLRTFPDVKALALASEDEVLRKWQGLGYYSRARNLHASAKHVQEHLGGIMPGNYQELLSLKGIGKYTAAAIASWCYNEPCAAVDGNVSRVIARLFGIEDAINSPAGEKKVLALAGELLDQANPGMHNQAMIEFGALQCVPRLPSCTDCPLAEACEANLQGSVDRIPIKIKNKKAVDRWFYYYMLKWDGQTILIQRGEKDIWAGLYELPLMECSEARTEEQIITEMLQEVLEGLTADGLPEDSGENLPGITPGITPGILQEGAPDFASDYAPDYAPARLEIGKLSEPVKHQLSHQTIHARFLQVELERLPRPLAEKWKVVALDHLDNYAMPRLIHRFLESSNF
jgi:A/G-specific adenine glycosylase